ncbi:outer membrane beta-barrel protein [Legionella bononiensis]|uniref:Outer membrane beta-barrel protein n=1 Tax=Legionella bononiensis TaxID=2793102 RepID=A0ABS1WEC6_9GAMM|nr:outer membrane beta-barrel protein [Legionella bononiensis]MBL7479413.1 outer membrane beta-barrel protein [Legionella bononiensis]MBL7527714.1 outer membrane beta-barrel protein [Legionella bononiensis]MBL7563603.1 outer membrane beta-barrel protein [Legionella bononiensis]
MNKVIKSSLLLMALCTTSTAINAATPGAYIGGGAGLSHLNIDAGLNRVDDSVFGGRAFFGYNFNNYLGIEANYSGFNKTHLYLNNNPLVNGEYSINALSLVGKLYLPLGTDGRINLYILGGAAQSYGKFDVTYQSLSVLNFSDNGVVPTAGLGINYDINEQFTGGLELSGFGEKNDPYTIGIPASSLLTLSLAYKF